MNSIKSRVNKKRWGERFEFNRLVFDDYTLELDRRRIKIIH